MLLDKISLGTNDCHPVNLSYQTVVFMMTIIKLID